MKRQVMQPFRAPRKGKAQSSPTRQPPRRVQKQDQAVHVVPYIKGIRTMSDREATECAQHGEVLRWSSESEGEVAEMGSETNEAQKDTTDSEEPTEMGLVWAPFVIRETQYSDVEDITENGKGEQDGTRFSIEANAERSPVTHHGRRLSLPCNATSPSCSEFEAWLESSSGSAVAPKPNSKNGAYWENVLEMEKQRLAMDIHGRKISVNEFMLGDVSASEILPVQADLAKTSSNLSLLVEVATTSNASPSLRAKKKPKVSIPKPLTPSHRITIDRTLTVTPLHYLHHYKNK